MAAPEHDRREKPEPVDWWIGDTEAHFAGLCKYELQHPAVPLLYFTNNSTAV